MVSKDGRAHGPAGGSVPSQLPRVGEPGEGAVGGAVSGGAAALARPPGGAAPVIEDPGTTVMDPDIEASSKGLDLGVPILDEPSHDGHTRKIRPGEKLAPALPFQQALQAAGAEGDADAGVPLLDEPEANTEAVRITDLGKPALPFQGEEGVPPSVGPQSAALPLTSPVSTPAGLVSGPVSTSRPAVGPTSSWQGGTGFDPSELPSAHLAEIAAPAAAEKKLERQKSARSVAPGIVLLLLALAVGGLLVAASVLRW